MSSLCTTLKEQRACDTEKVTRFEVIDCDTAERVVVRYGVEVVPVLQDDGLTLKVFVKGRYAKSPL